MQEYLRRVPTFANQGRGAINPGLETIQRVLDLIGSPQFAYPTIHIAGTNGKGTTSRLLASILMESGLKTGITTSPHLLSFHERIQIGDEKITDEQFLTFFRETGPVLKQHPLSYFELMTAAAFWHFAKQQVDVAVVETGLGGRLDATNVVLPVCSIITSISMDHTDLLGETLESIAIEKGGIIKSGIPIIVSQLPPQAFTVLKDIASKKGSPLWKTPSNTIDRNGDHVILLEPELIVEVNRDQFSDVDMINLPTVLTCVKIMQKKGFTQIDHESIRNGLQAYRRYFPLRSTFSKINKEKSWYYDGAHNVESITLLITQLQKIAPLHKWTLVFSMMKDKLNAEILTLLSRIGRRYFVPVNTDRAASYEDLLTCWNASFSKADKNETSLNPQTPEPPILLQDLSEISGRFSNELVIFTGSFYFYEPLMNAERNHRPFHT